MPRPSCLPLSAGVAASLLAAASPALAQKANTWAIIGDAKVSAQQMFLGTANTIYIVDKTEDNPGEVNGHPAWAAEYDLRTGESRMMDIVTNSFCAGGISLGDGRWINAGGNQAIGSGGVALNSEDQNVTDVYDDGDGGTALRVMTPCDDGSCEWSDDESNWMNSRRWYPELETLPEGDAIIIGGDQWGGFVDDAGQNNPTYEFFPKSDSRPANDTHLQFLEDTLPVDLYPLTWLLPSGLIFLQAGWKATLLDYVNNVETRLPDIPDAVKVYPASGATSMLTQNKANNWTAPILFCGGSDVKDSDWTDHQDNVDWWINQHKNAKTCSQITPSSADAQWESLDDDDMPETRSMGQLIPLPDGRWFLVNGIENGVAGYDASGIPYGADPVYSPAYFDPNADKGKKWNRDGIPDASLPRLYHSTALLAPDGSVITAGSNPYADFQTNGSMINAGANSSDTEAEWWSETRLEAFYPDYYDKTRPSSFDVDSISYGGDAMEFDLSADELEDVDSAEDIMAVLIRPGFSTHAINMGQRRLELETSVVKNGDTAKLHVAPLPPNPAVLAPGPCLFFKVINGVPSNGTMVMIGNGELGTQPTAEYPTLPETSGLDAKSSGKSKSNTESDSSNDDSDSSSALALSSSLTGALAAVAALGLAFFTQ